MNHWPVGTQIMWREGAGPLGTGPLVVDPSVPHFAQPVTVVRDDADGLVVWLPIGASSPGGTSTSNNRTSGPSLLS